MSWEGDRGGRFTSPRFQGDDGGVLTDLGAPWELSDSARVLTAPVTIMFIHLPGKKDSFLPSTERFCFEKWREQPICFSLWASAGSVAGYIFFRLQGVKKLWVRKKAFRKDEARCGGLLTTSLCVLHLGET